MMLGIGSRPQRERSAGARRRLRALDNRAWPWGLTQQVQKGDSSPVEWNGNAEGKGGM